MQRFTLSICCLMLCLAVSGCGNGDGKTSGGGDSESSVYTTFFPTTWLAKRIVGDAVPVYCPLPDGVDPAGWQPSREMIGAYQDAGLIVLNGAGYEEWVARASLPQNRLVDTTSRLKDLLTYKTPVTHTHADGSSHTHNEDTTDGHTWMDPVTLKQQALSLVSALTRRFPDHAEKFRAGMKGVASDLDALDAKWKELQPILERSHVLASYPTYNYAARRYGFKVTNFNFDPKKPLTDLQMAELGTHRMAKVPVVMLWDVTPMEATAEALQKISITPVVFSSCKTAPGHGDYVKAMHENLDRLKAALGG